MQRKTALIVLAGMLAMSGCELHETYPETPVQAETQRETIEAVTERTETGSPSAAETEKPAYADNPTVQAVFRYEYSGECDEYAVSDSEYAEKVVFITDGAVRDFRLITLTLEEITDDGRISFRFGDLYDHGDLTPERGLAVTMNLPETIPYYGISYTDGTGTVRVFSVNLSGFDGSVYLSEIGGTD